MHIGTNYSRTIRITIWLTVLFGSIACAQEPKYPNLSKSTTALRGDAGMWDSNKVHTLSIVKLNRGGYTYWGYYGLSYYSEHGGLDTNLLKAGLARSNDLIHWEKYEGNPIIQSNCRWPTAVTVGSTIYLFCAQYDYATNDSWIVMVSSKDGIHFHDLTVVVPREKGMQNQNPFIYFNKADGAFYLFYYSGIEKSRDSVSDNWNIMVRKSLDIEKLNCANPTVLLTSRYTMAAPSISLVNSHYYLLVEAWNPPAWGNKWVTLAYESDRINGRYRLTANSPVLSNNDACALQYVFGKQLYIFYSHCFNDANGDWDLRMVKAAMRK